MHKTWDEKFITNCEISFITPWCPRNKFVWYRVIILSAHISGMASSTVSPSGVVIILKSKESNNRNLSARFSTLCIAPFFLGNLF